KRDWSSDVCSSDLTTSVSTATALVITVPDALSAGFPTDVAVTVAVLIVLSAVPVGTETLTHTSVELPDATVEVVVSGVVQVESRKLTGNVPPLADML